MKVAISTPTAWPYVRRGGERFVNGLARFLAGRGHEVTVITSRAGPGEVVRQNHFTTVYLRQLWHPSMGRIGLLQFHTFFLRCFPSLLARRYDVIHCCTFLDTFAAILARRFTGTPCVFWVHSLPPPVQYFRSLTLNGAIFRRAMREADEVVCLSSYMQDHLETMYGRPGLQIPPAVDLDEFPLSVERDPGRTVILCAATLDDERKGGRLLMRAFDRLKERRPEARLHVCGHVSAAKRAELVAMVSPRWRSDVEFLDSRAEELPALYGQATISVLPSLWEAFGLVLVESMATGTPVVGTRSGAIPEVISDPRVGRVFEPGPTAGAEPTNVDGLVQTMLEAIELSRDPETPWRCRRHAAQFAWPAIGMRLEQLYVRLARGGRAATGLRSEPVPERVARE